MNYGKVAERSSSRSRYPNTARFAATSVIPTVILSRSDRVRTLRTVSARYGCDADLNVGRRFLSSEPGDVECREEDEREDGCDQQPSHDRKGHRSPEHRRGDWDHAEDRRDRRQHDGSKASTAGVD